MFDPDNHVGLYLNGWYYFSLYFLHIDWNTLCEQRTTLIKINLNMAKFMGCHSRRNINTHTQVLPSKQRVNGHPPPLRNGLSHGFTWRVWTCVRVFEQPYIYWAMWPQNWSFVDEAVSPVSVHFCLRGPVWRSLVGGNWGAFLFNFPKISQRKTSQWVICWKMALSCLLRSLWERDIQVSL